MKKILLIAVLLLGVASTASAVTPNHEAQYLWFYNSDNQTFGTYGTLVDQLYPDSKEWVIGNITGGETIAEVREKWWLEDGIGIFEWTLWNDDRDNILIPDTGITSLHIKSCGFEPLSYTVPYAGTQLAWSFYHDGEYYIWTAPEGGALLTSSLGGFGGTVDTPYYEISNGAIDYTAFDGDFEYTEVNGGDGFWRLSHPAGVPEPSSMLLLGMGLVGLAGRVVKKVKA